MSGSVGTLHDRESVQRTAVVAQRWTAEPRGLRLRAVEGGMSIDSDRRTSSWQRGLRTGSWATDETTYAALLDALTRDRLSVEAVEREMDATSRRSLGELQETQEEIAREELDEARRVLQLFRSALDDARTRGSADPTAEVSYDAADPRQDAQADMLIQYLVRPGYAEVRTEEPEPGHYVYAFRIDWDRLQDLATEHGHPLAS
jgi:hypothetical protein